MLLDGFDGSKPFALLKRRADPFVLCLSGRVSALARLDEIPRRKGKAPAGGEVFDTLSILPFRQAEELGFCVNHKDEKILTLEIEAEERVPLDEMIALLPDLDPVMADAGAFEPGDAEFSALVARIIADEIGEGEGCNFVVPRRFHGKITNFDAKLALSFMKRLLSKEYGAYWTFLYFTGEQYFIGATPERHLSVFKQTVKMNPISGTFRKMEHAPAAAPAAMEAFLHDPKEIFELLMVTDEELKMMSELCSEGGHVVGPMLKEMAKLVHTEYVLVGKSHRDVIDMLRESMFAATVVGSPIENACRVVARHDPSSRRYYGSALALLGRDDEGGDTLDSPITIRTAEITQDGALEIGVGATLVRNSVPDDETAETKAKTAGLRAALGLLEGGKAPSYRLGPDLYSEDVMVTLSARNAKLSRFWIEDQSGDRRIDPLLAGKSVTIIDNEDSFTKMLRHMMQALGLKARIVRHEAYKPEEDAADLVVLGPGPGDPRDLDDPKMARARRLCDRFLADGKPLLCICLGHQILCGALGLPLAKKQKPFQGTQEQIDLFGVPERVGFYNTFTGKMDGKDHGTEASFDPQNGEIHALKGPRFAGLQFHPESILTTNGLLILDRVLKYLLRGHPFTA